MQNLEILVKELIKLPEEVQWLEFKHNNYNPDMIGKDISALANGAALKEKSYAYMIWGIDDKTHEIVGTDYNIQNLKKGEQELENWLRSLLSPNADFNSYNIKMNNKNICVLIISCAANQPVKFERASYIRIGSYTKKLNEYPEVEAKLWENLRNIKFEDRLAKTDLSPTEVFKSLEYAKYFELKNLTMPLNEESILHYLIKEEVLVKQDNGLFAVTNMGAILFAKNLLDFPKIARKSMRIIQYKGKNRMDMLREYTENKGYAVDFENMVNYMETILPSEELITDVLRKKQTAYPKIAIRELMANALIHQDFTITGTGPVVEIFENRIEVSNPGVPLVDIYRIIDNPPKSRNEKLAALMRRLGICEELGTGWDKIIISCESMQLPAPKIDLYEENTKVTIFSTIPYTSIANEDRLWACYLHACIKYVQGEEVTNRSLRERFGLETTSSGSISRLIKEAVEKEFIKPFDPNTAPRYMKYIPIWA